MHKFSSSKGDQSVDRSQGFGSFDFAPYADQAAENCPRHEADAWESKENRTHGDAKATRLGPFPITGLPLEIRRSIYTVFVDALRGGRKIDGYDLGIGDGIRFRLSDTLYEPDNIEINYDLAVYGPPDQRNVRTNQDALEVVDIFNTYIAIKDETMRLDQVPSGWNASIQTAEGMFENTSDDEAGDTGSDSNSESDLEDTTCQEATLWSSSGLGRWAPAYRIWVSRVKSPASECYHSCDSHNDDGTWTSLAWALYCGDPPPEMAHKSVECECPNGKGSQLDDCICSYRQRADYDNVRHLAAAHPQVARELGEMLWEGATLDVGSLEVFPAFAADRPAALSRVAAMVLHIAACGDAFDTITSELEAVCRLAGGATNLRVCTVVLRTTLAGPDPVLRREDPDAMARAEARLQEWAPLFRGIRVRERFVVFAQGMNDDCGDEIVRQPLNDNAAKLRERLLEMWQPDCPQPGRLTEEI